MDGVDAPNSTIASMKPVMVRRVVRPSAGVRVNSDAPSMIKRGPDAR